MCFESGLLFAFPSALDISANDPSANIQHLVWLENFCSHLFQSCFLASAFFHVLHCADGASLTKQCHKKLFILPIYTQQNSPLIFFHFLKLYIDMILTSKVMQAMHFIFQFCFMAFKIATGSCGRACFLKHKQFYINTGNKLYHFSAEWWMPLLFILCENHKNEKSEKGRSVWVSYSFFKFFSSSLLKAENMCLLLAL